MLSATAAEENALMRSTHILEFVAARICMVVPSAFSVLQATF